jgi:D-serine deaminase-like pyridoxal phosphate-dependent protein
MLLHMEPLRIENEHEIPSPALLILRKQLEHNLQLMLKIAGSPQRLRPHVKTHKMADILRLQVELGILHYKCSTVAEVEMCAASGAKDVLLAMPPTEPVVQRLAQLTRHYPEVRYSVLVDHSEHLELLRGTEDWLGFFVDLDCGMARTGIAAGPEALALIRRALTLRLQFRGLHAYDGHIHDESLQTRQQLCAEAMTPVLALRDELLRTGVEVPEMVAGGSPTFGIHAAHEERTLSPGTPVLWDFGYGDKFPDLPFQHAAVLLTRVISKPGADRLTLDLGHKAVAPENPHPRLRLLEEPDAEFLMQSEEHLVIRVRDRDRYSIGHTFHAIPRHVCPTVSMYGEAYVIEQGRATQRWPVTARSRRITV